jgi:hypothetical protein
MDSCSNEKFNFELLGEKDYKIIERDDKWRVAINKLEYREYPPDSSYYYIRKIFYENGHLKEAGELIPPSLKIGIWYYYRENGCLIKTVNEDVRFGKVKPEDILNFAKKNQRFADADVYYNVIVKQRAGFSLEIKSASTIVYEEDEKLWILRLFGYPGRTTYKIDGDSGDVKYITLDYFDGTGKSNTIPSSLNIFN